MENAKKRAKEFLDRYFDLDDTYGASDFVDDIRSLVEESPVSEFRWRVSNALDRYDTKMSYGEADLVYDVDVLVNGLVD